MTDARTRVRQRIKRLLEDRGYTQGAFARALGHKDQWASNFFKGAFALSLDQLDDASKFLHVPPGEIVRISDEPWELTQTEMRVVRALRMLPPVIRDHLVDLADYLIGATPIEVDLLKRIRRLTPDQFRRIEHYMDVELLHRDAVPSLASPSDLAARDDGRSRPVPHIRGQRRK